MSDPRRTIHITAPADSVTIVEVEDEGSETRVPCFECDATGLVTAEKRAEQRQRAGMPPSSLPADRHERDKP